MSVQRIVICVFTLMFLGGSIAAADSSASPAASPAAASQDHQAAAGADHASPGTGSDSAGDRDYDEQLAAVPGLHA
jgi:hypothetical protein